jgi:hypothetical protein
VADAGVLESEFETPPECDEPPTVADNFMLAMRGSGIKLSFSSAKLVPGHGLAVCTILDALLWQSLKKRRFAPSGFRAVSGLGCEQGMETVSGEGEGIIDDAVDVDIDIDEPDDDGVAVVGFDADTTKIVDGLELQKEAERVASRRGAAADPNPRREERLALALRDDGAARPEDHGADGADGTAGADPREGTRNARQSSESSRTNSTRSSANSQCQRTTSRISSTRQATTHRSRKVEAQLSN